MLHINKFLDKIKVAQSHSGNNRFSMTLQEARDLHSDITQLLLVVHQLQSAKLEQPDQVNTTVSMDGGNWSR